MSEEEATDFRRAEFEAFKKKRVIDTKNMVGQEQQQQMSEEAYDEEFEKIKMVSNFPDFDSLVSTLMHFANSTTCGCAGSRAKLV